MKKQLKYFAVSSLVLLASCQKEKVNYSNHSSVHDIALPDEGQAKLSEETITYMESQPDFDIDQLRAELNKSELKGTKAANTWGIGGDLRVYKWNGSSWSEPNAAARLRYVEAGTYGTGVWGIGSDLRIYKWNSTTGGWDEPNPAAGAYYITAFSETVAVCMGYGGNLYITYDGGSSWYNFTSIINVQWMSCGNQTDNFIWARNINGQLLFFDVYTNNWQVKSPSYGSGNTKFVSAMFVDGVWTTDFQNRVYRSNDGVSFVQPNTGVFLSMIAGRSASTAWGIGSGSSVWRTTNGGATWSQPNPSAGLIHISTN